MNIMKIIRAELDKGAAMVYVVGRSNGQKGLEDQVKSIVKSVINETRIEEKNGKE